jgi:hypothetical protein
MLTWNYRVQDESIRHMGPVAEDLYQAFGLGEDSLHITGIDADGIALAAIKGLHKENQQLKSELEDLRRLVENLMSERDK